MTVTRPLPISCLESNWNPYAIEQGLEVSFKSDNLRLSNRLIEIQFQLETLRMLDYSLTS